jgi:hypothetical protein
MFDTNAFNQILDGSIDPSGLPKAKYFVTNLQEAEIRRTSDGARRQLLQEMFAVVNNATGARQINQKSTPWGSPWGSPWDQGGEHYGAILKAMKSRKKKDRGNSYDAVLIETCLYENIRLISNECAVREIAAEFGAECESLPKFLRMPR